MTTDTLTADVFQRGAYTRRSAAYLARLKPQTVTRWFDGDNSRRGPIRQEMPNNEDGLVNFDDLIQLLGVREIRLNKRISLQKIRAIIELAERLKIPSPFVGKITKVHLYGTEPVLETPDGAFLDVTGKQKHEPYLIKPVIMPFLDNLTIENGETVAYRPMPGILLAPKRQWGAPIVESCNCLVSTLVSSARGEGSIADAANMCGVSEDEVKVALYYEDVLAGVAA